MNTLVNLSYNEKAKTSSLCRLWNDVMKSVTQGFILGHLLFNILPPLRKIS